MLESFLIGKHLAVLLSFLGTSKEYKPRSNFYGSFFVHKSRRSKLDRWFEVGLNVVCKHSTSHNIPSAPHSSSPEFWWRHFPPTITEHMVGSSPAPMMFSLKSLNTAVIHMKKSPYLCLYAIFIKHLSDIVPQKFCWLLQVICRAPWDYWVMDSLLVILWNITCGFMRN